jgi:hypothetical protein
MLAACLMMSVSQTPLKVDDVRFMSGSWTTQIWGGDYEETWTEPSAGTMLGVAKFRIGDTTKQIEFLQIEPRDAGLIMWIQIGPHSRQNRRVVSFKCTSVRNNKATFESNGNDYPAKITYEQVEGGLKATLEGVREGKALKEEFNFTKAPKS